MQTIPCKFYLGHGCTGKNTLCLLQHIQPQITFDQDTNLSRQQSKYLRIFRANKELRDKIKLELDGIKDRQLKKIINDIRGWGRSYSPGHRSEVKSWQWDIKEMGNIANAISRYQKEESENHEVHKILRKQLKFLNDDSAIMAKNRPYCATCFDGHRYFKDWSTGPIDKNDTGCTWSGGHSFRHRGHIKSLKAEKSRDIKIFMSTEYLGWLADL